MTTKNVRSIRPASAGESDVAVDPDLVLQQLQRILKSRQFARSARMRRFLTCLLKASTEGHEGLSEKEIAVEVFDKTQFDRDIDPIVRVEARRLRKCLAEYYAGEGANDPLIISLPQRTWRLRLRPRSGAGKAEAGTKETAVENNIPRRSIAVLPFVNLTDNRAGEMFCQGVREELTNALAHMETLKVAARSSAFQFQDPADVREIGVDLGVAMVLEGTVRQSDQNIRVTAQLSNSSDGFQVWSETFDVKSGESLATQEKVAQKIANATGKQIETAG
jgi:TolB-like protein